MSINEQTELDTISALLFTLRFDVVLELAAAILLVNVIAEDLERPQLILGTTVVESCRFHGLVFSIVNILFEKSFCSRTLPRRLSARSGCRLWVEFEVALESGSVFCCTGIRIDGSFADSRQSFRKVVVCNALELRLFAIKLLNSATSFTSREFGMLTIAFSPL